MDKNKALELWEKYYGDSQIAYDYAAQLIKKEDYENPDSNYNWTLDYIKPLKSGGLNIESNLLICSNLTKNIRDGKPSFKIGNAVFEMRKGKKFGTFSLFDVTDHSHPVDVSTSSSTMTDETYNKERQKKIYGRVQEETSSTSFELPDLDSIQKNEIDKIDIVSDDEYETPELVEMDEDDVEYEDEAVSEDETEINEDENLDEAYSYSEDTVDEFENKDVETKDVIDDVDESESSVETNDETLLLDSENIDSNDNESEVTNVEEMPIETAEPIDEIVEQHYEEENDKESETVEETTVIDEQSESQIDTFVETDKDVVEEKVIDDSPVLQETKVEESVNNELLKEYEDVNNRLSVSITENEVLKKSLNEESSIHGKMIGEARKYQEEREVLVQAKNSLYGSNVTLLETLKTLETKLSDLKDKKDSLLARIEIINKEKEELLNKNNTLIANLETNKESNNAIAEKLDEENNSLREQLAQRANEYAELQNKYFAISEKYTASIESLNAAEVARREDQEIISSLRLDAEIKKNEYQKQNDNESSFKAELETLKKENEELSIELNELKESKLHDEEDKISKLNSQLEQVKHEKDELDTEIKCRDTEDEMAKERFRNVSYTNDELHDEIDDLKQQLEEKKQALENNSIDVDKYQAEINTLKEEINTLKENNAALSNSVIACKAEKDSVSNEKESLYEKTLSLNAELSKLKEENAKLDDEKKTLSLEKEESDNNNKETLDRLIRQKTDLEGKLVFIANGGDIDRYPDYLFYLSDTDKENKKDSVLEALASHPTWYKKDAQLIAEDSFNDTNVIELGKEDISYIDKEKEERNKAFNYWALKCGDDVLQTTDFAGRVIDFNHYQDKDSSFGWDFVKVDQSQLEDENNIIVMNLRTIADFNSKEPFTSNGQKFRLVKLNGVYKVESDAYITNPYDLTQALRITKENVNKDSVLIYIYVKCLGVENSVVEISKQLEFFDLIDRTVRRICPKSFIEMKTLAGSKNNYAFITFDGDVEGAYTEALNYAILLNSYRSELKKEANGLNAIIVLNKVMVPYAYRHLPLDQIISASKNVELRAVSYEFNFPVVNSLIKKTLHIGPSIVDDLPIDQSRLKPSEIGRAKNFAEVYNFKDHYYTYNFVFALNKKSEEDN